MFLQLIRVNIRQVKYLLGSQAGKEVGHLLDAGQIIRKMTFPSRITLITWKSLI